MTRESVDQQKIGFCNDPSRRVVADGRNGNNNTADETSHREQKRRVPSMAFSRNISQQRGIESCKFSPTTRPVSYCFSSFYFQIMAIVLFCCFFFLSLFYFLIEEASERESSRTGALSVGSFLVGAVGLLSL